VAADRVAVKRYGLTIAACLLSGLGAGYALHGTSIPMWVLAPLVGILLLRSAKRGKKRPDGWSACRWERAHPVASSVTVCLGILGAGAGATLLLPAHQQHAAIRFTLAYGIGSSFVMCCVLLVLQRRA
jgi:hypothetical protein